MSAHQFLSPFFILKLVSFILLSSLLNARVANALPNPHINPQKRLVSITALLQSAGLDVKTYAYGDDVAPQVKTELKKISVTTPTDTKINIGKELPSIGAYLSDRPYEKKTVDIIVTKKDDDQVLAFYNFDLGKNMNPEDQAANGADDKTAILGLKWVHDSFRGTKSALGTSPGKYTLNMAITEMGWQIM
jgi:hypothetical protein